MFASSAGDAGLVGVTSRAGASSAALGAGVRGICTTLHGYGVSGVNAEFVGPTYISGNLGLNSL